MSKMMPAHIRENAPRSERVVFGQLHRGPKSWVVMQSVAVPVPNRNPREIDFLILIPDQAVICLEVKGGVYSVSESEWYRPGGQRVESPLSQAEHAMYALKDYLSTQFPGDHTIRNIPLDHAVVFTDAEWPPGEQRPAARQFYDTRVVQKEGELVKQLADFVRTVSRRRSQIRPTVPTLDRLRHRLMPDVAMKYAWTLGPDLARIDSELLELTEEQYAALQLAQDDTGHIRNNRVLFEGAAGTGKTMLALQLAKTRQQAGDRVAVVCANTVLAYWLRRQLPELDAVGIPFDALVNSAEVPSSVLRQYTLEMSRVRPGHDDECDEILERYALESVELLEQKGGKWDYLIVDELQYFNREAELNMLDLALEGGLSEGRWAMFGDFMFQNWLVDNNRIAAGEEMSAHGGWADAREHLRGICRNGWTESVPLTRNCRNTEAISQAAAGLMGQDAPPLLSSQVEGPPVVYRYWRDGSEAGDLLADEIGRLHSQGVGVQQIAVITSTPYDHLHGRQVSDWPLWVYSDEKGPAPERGRWLRAYYATNFAGMESDVVVMMASAPPAGIEANTTYDTDIALPRFYLGMTRAKGALIVLAHESSKILFDRAQ